MSLTECFECNGKVSSLALACPHCGYPVNEMINNKVEEVEEVVQESNVCSTCGEVPWQVSSWEEANNIPWIEDGHLSGYEYSVILDYYDPLDMQTDGPLFKCNCS